MVAAAETEIERIHDMGGAEAQVAPDRLDGRLGQLRHGDVRGAAEQIRQDDRAAARSAGGDHSARTASAAARQQRAGERHALDGWGLPDTVPGEDRIIDLLLALP